MNLNVVYLAQLLGAVLFIHIISNHDTLISIHDKKLQEHFSKFSEFFCNFWWLAEFFVFYSTYSKALRDADRILITLEDPSNAKALLIKGDAQYNLGDFEHSLISYYRALKHSTTKVCVYFEKHYTHGHLVCWTIFGGGVQKRDLVLFITRYFVNLKF